MSDDVNQVTVSGRLTRRPERRTTPSGAIVTDFAIASNRYHNGEQKTTYFKTTLWNKAAEWFGENLNTGDHVLITGRMVDDNFKHETGVQTSGRMKIENAHVTILRKANAKEDQDANDGAPEQIPEV